MSATTIEMIDAFAAGLYLLFAVVNFDLWRKRPDRSAHLWLAIASAGALLVDVTGMMLRGSSVPAGVLPLANLMGVGLVTMSLLELVQVLSGPRARVATRTAWVVVLFLAAGCGLLGLVPPGVFFLTSFAILVWSMIHAFRAGIAGDPESRVIAGGILVLLVTLMVDLLRELGIVNAPPAIPVAGFAFLFLLSASSLNTRFEREYRELVALRLDLERRVQERTRDLEEANAQLAITSRTDALTGLPNRRGFFEEVERRLAAAPVSSLLMLDLDHFKQINDRYGHVAGDELLRGAAEVLRELFGPEVLLARWGGEEFIALMPPGTEPQEAGTAAERVRRGLGDHSFARFAGSAITASFGVAGHRRGDQLDHTIAAADRALYLAKELGRNRVVVSG